VTGRPRLHWPTVLGRARRDRGLLALTGLVVVLTTALSAAVAPVTERTADRAVAGAVRAAGSGATVVATLHDDDYDDPAGRAREPRSAQELRQDARYARFKLPRRLASVLRPGVVTLTSRPVHLLDDGPGRYLRLAYVDTPAGVPAVRYTAGGPPRASIGPRGAGRTVPPDEQPWPVQVALSEEAAAALGVAPGSTLPAEDDQHRPVRIVISGTYAATDPDADAWRVAPDLLHPTQGITDAVRSTSAAALVSPESLPDLRVGVAPDELAEHVVFARRPTRVRWRRSAELQRAVASLQATAGATRQTISWDSRLDRVLGAARAEVASARGQAQVLLVGCLATALLLLVLAAQLLVRRRAGSLSMTRARGASLLGVGGELLVEALVVAVAATATGLLLVRLLAGPPGWASALPVLVVASTASPVLGAALAARTTDAPRVPANRSVRRAAARARHLRRFAVEVAVLAVAALSYVALRQRGVVGDVAAGGHDGGDLTGATAATWWAVAGALVVLRLLPPAIRLALRHARGSRGGVRLLVLVRLAQTATRALPLLVVTVAVAQLTLGAALAATERSRPGAGGLEAVGGGAPPTAPPSAAVGSIAQRVARRPGVRAVAAARVVDGAQVSSTGSADAVRLVVVDASAYERLLAASPLPDAPQLSRLRGGGRDRVPALLLGGDSGLRDGLAVSWDGTSVPLDVVGTAPQVGTSTDPVVVVDAGAFTRAGALAQPDTVWAVGPSAGAALEAAAGDTGTVLRYADELDLRREAPLPAALVVLAVLGVVLAAAAEAPPREESLGRLRSLGLPDADLRRVLAGEVAMPVALATVAGLVLGGVAALATFGSLSLDLVTGQQGSPALVVPWWTVLAAVVLVAAALVVAGAQWRRLRRRPLAELLRS
jgi:putative ABC transport system permease protein